MRRFRGHTSIYPQNGETLICLRNNRELGLFNGLFSSVTGDSVASTNDDFVFQLSIRTEEGDKHEHLPVSAVPFMEYTDPNAKDMVPWYIIKDAVQFDYGYAITCHKAQGSEWNSVLVVDDGIFTFGQNKDPEARRRWLYTAVTRAKDTVHIVKPLWKKR
jgi:exodeoxyribonuclease-5